MVVVVVGVEGLAEVLHGGGVQLAVFLGQANHLVARVLDGAGLVGGHMAGGGGNDALPALQHGGNDDGVRLGAAGDEGHVGIRAGAGRANLLLGACAVRVGAVAGHLLKVGLHQLLQDGGVGALAVVVFKIVHFRFPSLSQDKFIICLLGAVVN